MIYWLYNLRKSHIIYCKAGSIGSIKLHKNKEGLIRVVTKMRYIYVYTYIPLCFQSLDDLPVSPVDCWIKTIPAFRALASVPKWWYSHYITDTIEKCAK